MKTIYIFESNSVSGKISFLMPLKLKPMIRKKVYLVLKRTLLMLLWLAFSHSLLAQQRVVTGTVQDEDGSALPGVAVIIKTPLLERTLTLREGIAFPSEVMPFLYFHLWAMQPRRLPLATVRWLTWSLRKMYSSSGKLL